MSGAPGTCVPVSFYFLRGSGTLTGQIRERKGQEEYLYSAIYYASIVSKRSDMDHTVLTADYTMPAFPSSAFTRWRHP